MGESNKSLPPTEKKLKDAREKHGNYLFSQEIVSVAVVFVGVLMLLSVAIRIPEIFNTGLVLALRHVANPNIGAMSSDFVRYLTSEVLINASMLFAGVAIVAIFANISQVGFVFSGVKIQKGLTFEQGLNVVANAKNLFSKRSLVTFLNSVIKVIIICYVSYYVITHDKRLATDIFSCRSDVLCALEVGASRIWWIMVYVVLALVPIAALDYLIQRKIYLTENMMSHDEVEKEYKEMEGDPHMKSHRRKMAQEIATGDGFARAKNASAIIRNPTHVAIALRYEPQTMALPYVVALGTDAEALEIIAHAEENGVPSYIDIPLARAMINDCAVDQFVPLQYMDQMVKFSAWLSLNHPERVFDTPEFGMASVGGFGDVKRG